MIKEPYLKSPFQISDAMKKANILIVENETIVAQDIKTTLEHLGYSISGISSTGKDAIEKAEKTKPDLILMDIHLKGEMNGIETTKKISDKLNIPVVFLTAYADDEVIERAKHVKAFGYIVKPFEENNLNSTIQLTLQKNRDIEVMIALEKDKTVDLDLYDRKILYELDLNAGISASEIGKKLRLPKGTINYRIGRLIDSGYINKFYTIINASLLGYQYYRVFMKFNKLTPEKEKEIIEFIRNESNCTRLRVTEGAFNLIFFTFHKNLGEVRDFLEKFNKRFGAYLVEKDINNVTKSYKFNQKFLLESKDYKQLIINHEVIGKYKADEIDGKIIKLLSVDARMKLIDMSKKIKVDWKVIKYRIKKMEDNGVIVAYTTELNLPKLDREIIQLDLSLKNISAIPDIIGFFNNTNTCLFARELLGKYDLSIELYIKNDEMLNKILNDFKKAFLDKYVYCDVLHIYREQIINSFKLEN